MEVYTDLLKYVVTKFVPEWEVSRTSISESFGKYRYITFDLKIGSKGYCGIMDKVAQVYDAIIGDGFGVVDINVEDANSTTPTVMFKVWDKEVSDGRCEAF